MSAALTIAQILAALQADLKAWENPPLPFASVSLAKDPFHVLELLTQNATGARLIISYAGTAAIGENEGPLQGNLGEHQIEIILGYSLGLTAEIDSQIAKARGDRPALGTVLDALRGRALGILWPEDTTRQLAQHKGTDTVVTPEGIPLAAYRVRIGLIALMQEAQEGEFRSATIV